MATSVSGGIVSSLFYLYLAIAVVVGALVLGWLATILVRFRAKPGQPRPPDAPKAGVLPAERGHPLWSYVMAILIAAIMFGLAFGTISAVHTLETPPAEGDRLDVTVTGFQFGWRLTYAGEGGVPLANITRWTVPVDTAIVAQVKSQDVWHNFALTEFRIRIDAIPGETNHIWWKATQTGEISPVCVQLCGNGHAGMRTTMAIVPQPEFEAYRAQMSAIEYAKLDKAGLLLNATYDGAQLDVEPKAPAPGKAYALRVANAAPQATTFTIAGHATRVDAGATALLYVPAGATSVDVDGRVARTLGGGDA